MEKGKAYLRSELLDDVCYQWTQNLIKDVGVYFHKFKTDSCQISV